MLYISPTLTGYILLLLSPITLFTYFNGHRIKKLSRTIKDNLAQMNICVEEKVGNIRTVKWFNQVEIVTFFLHRNEENILTINVKTRCFLTMIISAPEFEPLLELESDFP